MFNFKFEFLKRDNLGHIATKQEDVWVEIFKLLNKFLKYIIFEAHECNHSYYSIKLAKFKIVKRSTRG